MFLQPQVRGPWRDALRITPSYRCQRGPRSSIWSFHHETNRDFKDAGPAGRGCWAGKPFVLPCPTLPTSSLPTTPATPTPWQAATVTSPPPRRAVSWEVGVGGGRWGWEESNGRQRSLEGCWEAGRACRLVLSLPRARLQTLGARRPCTIPQSASHWGTLLSSPDP